MPGLRNAVGAGDQADLAVQPGGGGRIGHSVTGRAVAAIGSITGTIRQLSDISAAIASAVATQSTATQQIARTVEQTAAGTTEVTSHLDSVTLAAGEAGEVAHQVLDASHHLSRQADILKTEVDGFVTRVRAT